ncbi:MAG: TonB family protein [Desulfobacteraceae bacterium]|jgi:protein TonB
MRRLLAAAVASAALHAAVLALVPSKPLQPPSLGGSRTAIEVSLSQQGSEKSEAADPAAVSASGDTHATSEPGQKSPQPTPPARQKPAVKKPPPQPPAQTPPRPVVKAGQPATVAPAPATQEIPAPTEPGEPTPSPGGSQTGSPNSAETIRQPAVPLYRRNPPPPYPRIAKARGYQGRTLLKVLVGPDGRVKEITVAAGSGYAVLDEAAVKAVRQWLFEPARQGLAPVAMWVTVPIRFQIR